MISQLANTKWSFSIVHIIVFSRYLMSYVTSFQVRFKYKMYMYLLNNWIDTSSGWLFVPEYITTQ